MYIPTGPVQSNQRVDAAVPLQELGDDSPDLRRKAGLKAIHTE